MVVRLIVLVSKWAIVSVAAFFAALVIYLAAWIFFYHAPPGPVAMIDVREDRTNPAQHYVIFCAGLADNPTGFPGHNFVIWSDCPYPDLMAAEAAGFVPRNPGEQIPSVWRTVPGLVLPRVVEGNLRKLDSLIAAVDAEPFQRSRAVRDAWDETRFRAGHRDCVSFIRAIARSVGLVTPDAPNMYPQDFLRQLKQMNAGFRAGNESPDRSAPTRRAPVMARGSICAP